ncbi:DUF883 family protein [Polaromonas sp.]|uniref:DUF883 family protein n=1 Tax=Polaromonas sp. TaxID=1869339 RepID=UPI001DEC9672|nr:DUF883 family protein [Polaromonas sp.]MBT9475519.1 DUF883 domain-containing protein [Polaromonas sp.]
MNDARTTLSHNQAQLAQDFKTLLNDAEELLRHASQGGDEGFNNARERLEKSLRTARREFDSREHALLDRARHAGRAADLYMHRHPWESISVAAVLGLMAGIVLAGRLAGGWIKSGGE